MRCAFPHRLLCVERRVQHLTVALYCSITATTVETALGEIEEACDLGADAIELRLDFLQDLKMNDPGPVLNALLAKCKQLDRPAIVTLRPDWEGCGTTDAAAAVHGAAGSVHGGRRV